MKGTVFSIKMECGCLRIFGERFRNDDKCLSGDYFYNSIWNPFRTDYFCNACIWFGAQQFEGKQNTKLLVLFTILFNGGLVPTYLMYTQLFHIKNTIWAQIFPSLLVNGFYVMLLRSYFRTNIPQELYEAARIDGASEGCVFFRICLPLSLPILATVGLMQGLAYWNSWLNGLYYLTDTKYYNIQNVLNRLLLDIRYLQSGFWRYGQ